MTRAMIFGSLSTLIEGLTCPDAACPHARGHAAQTGDQTGDETRDETRGQTGAQNVVALPGGPPEGHCHCHAARLEAGAFRLRPEAVGLIIFAKAHGLKLGLMSDHGAAMTRAAARWITHAGTPALDIVLPRAQGVAPKPDPAPYITMLMALALTPKRVMAFDDSTAGLRSARVIGIEAQRMEPGLLTWLSAYHGATRGAMHRLRRDLYVNGTPVPVVPRRCPNG